MSGVSTLRRTSSGCLIIVGLLAGCTVGEEDGEALAQARGQLLLEQYDCGRCHVIPGVRRANGRIGPSLETFAHHVYLAGEVPNRPEVLLQWIPHPSSLVPDTLMPDQPMPAEHARDMGAYLMSLR